jgi:hypothetical protein
MLQECQQALKVYLGSLVEDAYYLNDHKKLESPTNWKTTRQC